MAEDSGDVLRHSLDAVDRHRKRLIAGLMLLGIMLLLTFFYTAHSVGQSTVNDVLAHYIMLLIWVTCLTLFVIIQIAAATKRILRAIELASKR